MLPNMDDCTSDDLPSVPPPAPLKLLGAGGMGIVESARDPSLQRIVALKRLSGEWAENDSARDDFVREARIMGQLQHPNVAPVYALATDPAGNPYFTMQVIEGCTLSEWVTATGLEVGARDRLVRGLEIVLRVCDAVAFAHSRGILHRDIKPSNIMVGEHGRVYLMDWGVAIEKQAAVNEQSSLVGTAAYMAPEQARGEPSDERTDIFGIGGVLCEVVAGRGPYGPTKNTLPWRAALGQVLPLNSELPHAILPQRLCEIVDRAIASKASDRYPSVGELSHDLRQFLQGGLYLPRRIFEQGATIIRQDEVGDTAYLLIEGRCKVIQERPDGPVELRSMGPGEIFGELALVLGNRRSATVVAEETTTVLLIDREVLKQSGALDGWSSLLLEALAKRFADLERSVRHSQ